MANQGSWPSIVYFLWNYKSDYELPTGAKVTVTLFNRTCHGTLISTRKILTTGYTKLFKLDNSLILTSIYLQRIASCIPTTLKFTYLGVSYTGTISLNQYYPTYDSMFSVYLGLYDKTSISNTDTYSAPTVKVNVADQRIVSFYLKLVNIRFG